MTVEEYKVDRTGWAPGPWDDEPDRIFWRDWIKTPVLPCLIVRADVTGALCGYVGVPPEHPWHGCVDNINVHVHGGVTYAGPMRQAIPFQAHPIQCDSLLHAIPAGKCAPPICHVVENGEAEPWWIGFDCSHAFDRAPALEAKLRSIGSALRLFDEIVYREVVYRDVAYVRKEVLDLAAQARAAIK